jgi:septal ring factor EnvC (AmiA/AmiB activator)
VYSAENAGSIPDHPFAQENTMKKPQTYDRMGSAVIKKPGGFLYLTEDVDPLLDQMEIHIDDAKDARKATSAAKVDVATLEGEVTEKDDRIGDLERELSETCADLKESKERCASLSSMLTRINDIATEGV